MKKNCFSILTILFLILNIQIFSDNFNGSKTEVAYVQPNQGTLLIHMEFLELKLD